MALYVDIEKKCGDFLLKVKFTAEKEVLGLLGASGCGKSMTLKCIAGIEKPDRGTITLDVSYIEDESLNHSCLIPRFTLQPLVENAIFHGIEPKGSAGEVTLRVERDTANGDVLIHLTDDGVGMTPEQAAKALQEPGPEEAAAKYRHVGMWNVHKRLQYSFGEAYGLSIKSEPDIGTTVTIRLPGPDGQK